MKNVYLYFCIIIPFIVFSCNNDEGINEESGTQNSRVNKWIVETMRKNYYWYEDIPENNRLSFNVDPQLFFKSLLSDKDGKIGNRNIHRYYSYIESNATSRSTMGSGELSLGFEYQGYYFSSVQIYAMQVLYILPNSPASRSTLKRGEWIYTVNDLPLTVDLINSLNTQSNVKLGISESNSNKITKWVTLSAESINDNPVYIDTTYHYKGKKIGYLVYNHFTKGIKGNYDQDQTYDNSLRKAFSKFKNSIPDDFILDLRYNSGGVVTSAQLLATMLAPESALNDIFCKMKYNNKQTNDGYTYRLDPNIIKQGGFGENINLKQLFVITSSRTASASEAVINGLKPYLGDNLILVGDLTEGKNVGSLQYEDSRFDWVLHPIVCQINNKDNFSDYADGFSPDIKCLEPYHSLANLGDTNEYILNGILNYIVDGTPIVSARSIASDILPIGSSLDRRKTNGTIMLPVY